MKWVKFLSVLLLFGMATSMNAQKAKIIKKTIDRDGNEKVEKIYAEGDEIEDILEDMDIELELDENSEVRIEIELDENGRETKRRVEVRSEDSRHFDNDFNFNIDTDNENHFKFRLRDGDEDRVFEWEGLENLPEELEEMMEELSLKFNFDEMELGDLGDIEMHNFAFANTARASLGVRIEDGSEEGVEIIEVKEDSAANEAGLEAGDLITAINGIPVNNKQDLIRKIGKYEPNERVELDVTRNGKSRTVKATLKERSY